MNSEVLALKYRPTSFKDLIGQKSVSETLSRALDSNKLAHAYLLSGLRGSGKTSTARILAKCMICDEGPTSKPCGVCDNCKSANSHMDIVEMDAASSRKIDDIRALIEQTKYKPAMARYKIFIIDEVHMLTKEAFNSLLKTLEEPPEYIKFILATTDPLKVPATILSRTQHFRFKKISTGDIKEHVINILDKEDVSYDESAIELIARSGNGSLRDTLNIVEQAIIFCKGQINLKEASDMLGIVNPTIIEEIFKSINEKYRQKALETLKQVDDYESENIINEMIAYLKEKLLKGDPLFPLIHIERFFKILNDAKLLLSINADDEFVLNLTTLKLCEAVNSVDIDTLIEEINSDLKANPPQESVQAKQNISNDESSEIKTDTQSSHSQNLEKFEKLKELIFSRDIILGRSFEESITFVSFKDGTLSWQSSPPSSETKKELVKHYGIINHFVKEVFGLDTKIVSTQVKKDINEYSMIKDFTKSFTT